LKKLGLHDLYKGKETADGADFNVSIDTERDDDAKNPFKAILDVGLVRTTTGARVFSAMKGACDGGINVPHSNTRFAGYESETKTFNPEVLRKYIFGGHVATYMEHLKENKPEKFRKQFSKFEAAGLSAGDLVQYYSKAHAAIRANPDQVLTVKKVKEGEKPKKYNKARLSYSQRKDRIRQKRASAAKKGAN